MAMGEDGLDGEIRWVTQLQQCLREATRLGYTRAIVPDLQDSNAIAKIKDVDIAATKSLSRAIEMLG